jgi:arylsulfatase A-like enzyme
MVVATMYDLCTDQLLVFPVLDSGLHNVSAALTSSGMWENTLMVFTADNGGVGALGNNHPLRT